MGVPRAVSQNVERSEKLAVRVPDKSTGEHTTMPLSQGAGLSHQHTDCFSESREGGTQTPLALEGGPFARLAGSGHARPLVCFSRASSHSREGPPRSSASLTDQARPRRSSRSPLFFCELRRANDFRRGRLCAYQWHLRACVQEATVSCLL